MIVLLMLGWLAPSVSARSAGAYGRWWWTGTATVGDRNTESLAGGATSTSRHRYVELGADAHGYLGDPTLGDFTAGLTWTFDRTDSGSGSSRRDSERLGYNLHVNFLPRGKFVTSLFASRGEYKSDGGSSAGPPSMLRRPDRVSHWGGKLSVRQGRLRGLYARVRRSTETFEGGEQGTSGFENLGWARSGRGISGRIALDRSRRDVSFSDLEREDIQVVGGVSAELGRSWGWELDARGLAYELRDGGEQVNRSDSYRWSNRFTSGRDAPNRWVFGVRGGGRRAGESYSDDLGADVRYVIGRLQHWSFVPFVGYVDRQSDVGRWRTLRAGSSVSWKRGFGDWDCLASFRSAIGTLRFDNHVEFRSDRNISTSLAVTVGHGDVSGLRKTLEVEAYRDDLDADWTVERPDEELPITTVSWIGTGGARVRGGLSHAWDSRTLRGTLDWGRSTRDASGAALSSIESVNGRLRFTAARYGITGGLSSVRFDGGARKQQAEYLTLAAYWRVRQWIRVWGNARLENRDVEVLPDVRGQRYEAGVALGAGLLEVDVFYSTRRERVDFSPTTGRDEFRLMLRRRFASYLPVTTGAQRRGVIR